MRNYISRSGVLPVVLFALFGFLAMGYHPGAEDDGVYLSAVKSDLNPVLYPRDGAFFQLQMRTSVFDNWMADFVRATGMPVPWSELLWQALSLLLMVSACWSIVSRLFPERTARWGALALFSAMLTIPVAGTALYLADQYLHPRNLSTALILFAISRIQARRLWQAIPLLAIAWVLHPLMGTLGLSFGFVLALTLSEPVRLKVHSWRARFAPSAAGGVAPVAVLIPFGWIFEPPSKIWLDAVSTRHWFRLYEWTWYEWLGAIAPLVLFWLLSRVARRQGDMAVCHFATAVLIYGLFQQAFAMIVLGPKALIALSTLEPMRYLQIVYVFLTLFAGAYLGKYVLRARVWRWAILLILAYGGMFFAQRQIFASTPHIELPYATPENPWLQAFAWVRANTPEDAYFALDPNYLADPGEDYHSFRALAERSVLADRIKDTSVISKVPEIGPAWLAQTEAQAGWNHFQLADFERLKSGFGVNWVVVRYPNPAGLDCRWHNAQLAVCRVP